MKTGAGGVEGGLGETTYQTPIPAIDAATAIPATMRAVRRGAAASAATLRDGAGALAFVRRSPERRANTVCQCSVIRAAKASRAARFVGVTAVTLGAAVRPLKTSSARKGAPAPVSSTTATEPPPFTT